MQAPSAVPPDPGAAAAPGAAVDGDASYLALAPDGHFPGMIVKLESSNIWWGLALPWRAMNTGTAYKLCTVLTRQEAHLGKLYRWLHGKEVEGRPYQISRSRPQSPGLEQLTDEGFSVSGFAKTDMLVPFLVWASCRTPVAGAHASRNKTNYQRSLEVVVSFINSFCAKVPHKWSVDLGQQLGGAVTVARGIVDLTTFWAAAAQIPSMSQFFASWSVKRETCELAWCHTTPPHIPLGEFIGICLFSWKYDQVTIWDCLLAALLRRLSTVFHHYVRYIASTRYLKELPETRDAKRDSLLICQWLRELLAQKSRRDLPECPSIVLSG